MKAQTTFTEEQNIRFKYKELRDKKIASIEWWDFIKNQNKEIIKKVISNSLDAEARIRKYLNSSLYLNKIKKYCNYHGYSDVEPYEVVKIITNKKVIIRKMDSELTQIPTSHIGGFAAHTNNYEQRWNITSNPNNENITITLTKNGWGKGQFRMDNEPIKFYDYNF